jgi:hypothetical protein
VHGRSFLEMLSQVLTLVLAYVNYRLVRMITMRADASIMDGIFHVENLILPALLFVLFYVVWHVNAMRHKAMPLQ